MGTKWVTPTISGYNSSAPSDDGSKVASNQMTWAMVKSKLSDSIKSWVDEVNTRLTNHFDEGPLNKTTTYTTTAADWGKFIECDGTFTLTLLAPSTGGAGYRVYVKNINTGTITVDVSGGANIDSSSSVSLTQDQVGGFVVDSGATKYLRYSS